jgi:N-acetylmuramoyl-L-alanine amidase
VLSILIFRPKPAGTRIVVVSAALFAALAVVWPMMRAEAQGATLTLLSQEGRRALPIARSGNDEMLALDELASVFSLTIREEVGAVTVSYRGQTIILTPGQSLASVAGNLLSLSAPLTRAGNRWRVPLDFLSRALAPIYDTPLDLHRPSRLLVVGNLRVPRVVVRYEPATDGTARVILDATPRAAATVVQGEGRLLVHYEADAVDAAIPAIEPAGVVQAIGPADATTLAVRLGTGFTGFRSTTQSLGAAARLTLDIVGEPPAAAPAPEAAPRPSASIPPPSFGPPATPIRTVVIDPGHGGDDAGTASAGGVLEKTVTLAVARQLKAALEGRLGMRVLLTRDDDRIVPIDQRTALANNNKADLFISLHANASFRSSVAGATILYASFEHDAAGESAVEGGELPAFGGGTRSLDLVLWNQAQARHVDQSAAFAAVIQQQLGSGMSLSDRPIQRAPLRVLQSANMPAVIVEMGYLSNPDDARRLATADRQGAIAQALFESVQRFRDLLTEGRP